MDGTIPPLPLVFMAYTETSFHSHVWNAQIFGGEKNKVHPITGHKGSEEGMAVEAQLYSSCNLSALPAGKRPDIRFIGNWVSSMAGLE